MATEVISTLKPTGGDYTSIAAWLTAIEGSDWITLDQVPVLECDAGDYTAVGGGVNFVAEQLTISTSNIDVDHPVVIRAATGSETNGQLLSGFQIRHNASFQSVITGSAVFRLDGIEIYNGGSSGRGITSSVDSCKITACVISAGAWPCVDADREFIFIGCRFNRGSIDNARYNHTFVNCLSDGGGVGFESNSATALQALWINCVSYGNSDPYETEANAAAGSTNNASDQYTTDGVPGVNGLLSNVVAGDFTDSANGDFSLSGSSQLDGAGSNQSATYLDHLGVDDWRGFDGAFSASNTPIGPYQPSASTVTGSLSSTETATDTLSSSGTVSYPEITGSLSYTEPAGDVFAGSGGSVVSGDLSFVEPSTDTLAGTGSILVSGDFSSVEQSTDVFASTGSVTFDSVTGDMSAVESGTDVFASNGIVVPNEITGFLSKIETSGDVFAGVGTLTEPTGDLAFTEPLTDTLSVGGTVAWPAITGLFSFTEPSTDQIAIDGALVHSEITGSLSIQEARTDRFLVLGDGVFISTHFPLDWCQVGPPASLEYCELLELKKLFEDLSCCV